MRSVKLFFYHKRFIYVMANIIKIRTSNDIFFGYSEKILIIHNYFNEKVYIKYYLILLFNR